MPPAYSVYSESLSPFRIWAESTSASSGVPHLFYMQYSKRIKILDTNKKYLARDISSLQYTQGRRIQGTYIRTVLSSLAEANMVGLVGFHATMVTERSCPSSVWIKLPFSRCQIYTFESSLPLITNRSSHPPKHDLITNRPCLYPEYFRTIRPSGRFHK